MDEIIGLLFLVVPVIFSLIGKKLEKASEGAPAGLPEPEVRELKPEEAPRSVRKNKQPKTELQARSMKAAVRYAEMEEENAPKKDPIDPKKLVIYSEIMKPKFKE
jgi:hypothetical protein